MAVLRTYILKINMDILEESRFRISQMAFHCTEMNR